MPSIVLCQNIKSSKCHKTLSVVADISKQMAAKFLYTSFPKWNSSLFTQFLQLSFYSRQVRNTNCDRVTADVSIIFFSPSSSHIERWNSPDFGAHQYRKDSRNIARIFWKRSVSARACEISEMWGTSSSLESFWVVVRGWRYFRVDAQSWRSSFPRNAVDERRVPTYYTPAH